MGALIVIVGIFLATPLNGAEYLNASGDSSQDVTVSTTRTAFSDISGLSAQVELSQSGKVLVLSSYSMNYASGGSRTGSWRLSDGTNSSLAVDRYISGPVDHGLGMAVNLFDYGSAPGTVTYSLQHATQSSGQEITTDHASLVAIPLVTQNGVSLSSSQAADATLITTSSTAYQEVLSGTVTLDHGGHVFMAAAFNTHTDGKTQADRIGQWKLQLETSPSTWLDVGASTQRFMTSTSDTGASMLMGICETDGLASGDYDYRLVMKTSASGEGVSTSNATLLAMGLQITEDDYLPYFQVTTPSDTTASTVLEKVDGTTETGISVGESGSLFLGASFSADVDGTGSINPALFGVAVEDETLTKVFESEHVERTIVSQGDIASGGIVSLADGLDSGTYSAYLEHATDGQSLLTLNPNLIGFSTTSVPEPSALFLIAVGGIAMVKRRKQRS